MIFITGGLGYLGGRIAAHLLHSGFSVRLGTSRTDPAVSLALQSADLKVIDLNSISSLRAAVRGSTAIIHLAGLNVDECARDPERAFIVNTLGTFNLVRAAIDENIARIIYFSTAHVYGAPLTGEIDELSLPRPAHTYSITHRSAEDYILQASDAGRFSGTILRLSNAVGPPVSVEAKCWTLLANDLSRQVIESNELVLRSSGRQQRNFVAMNDIVTFVERMLDVRQNQFTGQIINLGGLKSLTILEMAQMVRDRSWAILRQRPKLVVPDIVNDAYNEGFDFRIDKAQRLGFSPNTDIVSEIDATLRMCREHFSK